MVQQLAVAATRSQPEPLTVCYLQTESDFYGEYAWCLDAVPPVNEIITRLHQELSRFDSFQELWHRKEIATNIFLLACALSDTVDDYLLGTGIDSSKLGKFIPGGRRLGGVANGLSAIVRSHRLKKLAKWRSDWGTAVEQFLKWRFAELGEHFSPAQRTDVWATMTTLLSHEFPAELTRRRCRIPAAFRSQDLTHFDVFAMANKFMEVYPERQRDILVVGLRTAGSYFAPLLQAYLKLKGFESVGAVTLRPKKGIAPNEKLALAKCASHQGLAVIVDEPVGTGGTLGKAVGLLRNAGVPSSDLVALFPIHPTGREWNRNGESLVLSTIHTITLEPEEWHKHNLLEVDAVRDRLTGYFQNRGYRSLRLIDSLVAQHINKELQLSSDEGFHTRLKRVYQVELQNGSGQAETRFVLAKSVGWGWLGYHAFHVARDLADFVPPMLGLRDGILYMEWLATPNTDTNKAPERRQLVESTATYVSARARHLRLSQDPSPTLSWENRHVGLDELTGRLSKAYGSSLAMGLKRAGIRKQLSRPCPYPTLIDGRMRRCEWIVDSDSIRKADFEHHGMGKHQLSMTDPAYDLADVVLHWRLSPEEESQLIARYKMETGDVGVDDRLFLNKLLAGSHSVNRALSGLSDSRLQHRHQEFNRLYIDSRDFLITQTLRFCSSLVAKANSVNWASPLVVLDIDGVLDKQIFGYPSTSSAGILALSLLHSHEHPVVLNTARTAHQMKQYCNAYRCVGGVAEYGSYVWDAVMDKDKMLVTDETLSQMQLLRQNLRRLPGIYLNDDYRYSVLAFVYERGVTIPLPTALISNLLVDLNCDRLSFHQTYTDTAVTAKETDKGRGLAELLRLAGKTGFETIAVGDSEPDLPMFRMATRSFAPANISCGTTAALLQCRITDQPYQAGLLQIVRLLLHPDGSRCKRCEISPSAGRDNLFFQLLQVADQSRLKRLLRACLDPMALRSVAERIRN